MWLVWSGGNDRFWDQHDRLHLRRLRPAEGRQLASRRSATRATTAGTTSAWSTSPASSKADRRPTRTGAASGSTCAPRAARPIRSRTRASTPASPSARAASRSATARRSRSARSTATPPASSACACSRTRPSTRRPPRPGTPSATTPTRATTTARTWCGPYRVGMSCGFCHVGPSPVNPPADPAHPEVREPQLVGGRAVHVGRPALHLQLEQARGPHELHVPARPHLPAGQRWTPRWSRPTASTTRAR